MTKLLQQCFLFFIVVVIPGHNLGNSQVSVNRTIGPTLVVSTLTKVSVSKSCFYNDCVSHPEADKTSTDPMDALVINYSRFY